MSPFKNRASNPCLTSSKVGGGSALPPLIAFNCPFFKSSLDSGFGWHLLDFLSGASSSSNARSSDSDEAVGRFALVAELNCVFLLSGFDATNSS